MGKLESLYTDDQYTNMSLVYGDICISIYEDICIKLLSTEHTRQTDGKI